MMTFFLSAAACALALSASTAPSQADTLNIYLLDGKKVENFDGSQLIGKTISDYKTMIATSSNNGVATVTKVHNICTNGKKAKNITMATSTTTVDGTSVSYVKTGDSYVSYSVAAGDETKVAYFIDGKRSTKEELGKYLPNRVASMTVLKPGNKEAIRLTNDKETCAIIVNTKKE